MTGKTQLDGSFVADFSLERVDLADNLLGGQDYDVTNGAKDATFKGLRDAVASDEPTTKGQLDAAIAAISAQIDGNVFLDGEITDLAAFEAAAHVKGARKIVNVSGTILGSNVNPGDNIILLNDVAAGTMTASDLSVIDNTESSDILRNSSVVDNLSSSDTDLPLSANQGQVLDNKISATDAKIKSEKFGEKPFIVPGQPSFTLANAPIMGSLRIYRRGLRMDEGSGNDYTVNYATGVVTFEEDLKNKDLNKMICDYKYN